tara:strand:+ start:678 stop:1124 length:447 start_codon:yes stop_codon:yes gene_type:complete
MKPRFEPRDEDFTNLLSKANELAGKVEKAKAKRSSQPEYTQKEGSEQGQERFMTQSAGKDNVQSAHFTTNNSLIKVEDVKNAGATSEKSNILDKPTQFPDAFDSQLKYRLNEEGGDGPDLLKSAGGNVQKYQDQQIRKSIETLSRRIN